MENRLPVTANLARERSHQEAAKSGAQDAEEKAVPEANEGRVVGERENTNTQRGRAETPEKSTVVQNPDPPTSGSVKLAGAASKPETDAREKERDEPPSQGKAEVGVSEERGEQKTASLRKGGAQRNRMGVCIVGDAQGMELQSKFEFFVNPMMAHYDAVDVLVLTVSGTRFGLAEPRTEQEDELFELAKKLHPVESSVHHLRVLSPSSPLLFEGDVGSLDEKVTASNISNPASAEVLEHVFQWSNSVDCYQGLLRLESEFGSSFSAIARLDGKEKAQRTGLLEKVQQTLSDGHIPDASRCASWLGFGDSSALAPRKFARAALLSGFWGFYLWPDKVGVSNQTGADYSKFVMESARTLHNAEFADSCP
uniref:Uncharacterized protein n=1 Tax=Erythrolobus madagascarensis TaxID=708628 RepID=A0A7S0TAH5_9RHOD